MQAKSYARIEAANGNLKKLEDIVSAYEQELRESQANNAWKIDELTKQVK